MKKKVLSVAGRVLIALLVIVFVVFIGLEIFIHSYNPVQTQLAEMATHEQLLTIEGRIVREEAYVTYDGSGVLDYAVEDGERVASGDTVALCYASSADAAADRRKAELQAQIDNIRDTSSVNDYYVLDLDHIKGEIVASLYGIGGATGETGLMKLAASVDAFRDNVTRKQAATGVKLDFSEQIASLEAEIASLEKKITSAPKKVKTSRSGYFFSSCDGYETSISVADIPAMTVESFAAVKKGEIPKNAVGKLATGFEWYYLFTTDRTTAQTFSEGGTVKLRFPVADAATFPATVKRVNYTGDEALVVLQCTNMAAGYAVARDQTLQVVTKTYEGLYVDDGAIRVSDGVTGVYVLLGVEVKFRRIEVLWSCEDYAIVKPEEKSSGGLRLYDTIITKGNDLYDGKLIYRQPT